MLNPYFNQSQNVEGESDLYEDLIIEAIQVVGEDLLYIQRLESDFNSLNEAQISELKKAFVIEAEVLSVENFGGDMDQFSYFGLAPMDRATFKMSIKRFKDQASFVDLKDPVEGDLLYMKTGNIIWEIKRVRKDDKFYIAGKRYCWIIECVLYQPNHEDNFQEQDFVFPGEGLGDLVLGDIRQERQDESNTLPLDAAQGIVEVSSFDVDNPFGDKS